MSEVSAEDRALLEDAATRLVAARMSVPAMAFLEMLTPANLVTASMLHALTPLLACALPAAKVERVARLLERRQTIPEFVRLLDEREEQRRRAAQSEKAARGRPAPP